MVVTWLNASFALADAQFADEAVGVEPDSGPWAKLPTEAAMQKHNEKRSETARTRQLFV